MRTRLATAFLLASLLRGQEAATPSLSSSLASEPPGLEDLLREAREHNPDLARAASLLQAERQKPAQARLLPDPSLSLGLQNEGFRRLEVGRAEGAYYQVMLTQGLPWPGKRALRGEVASLGAQGAQAALARTRLSLEADVRRAYVELLLTRQQLSLLSEQESLLQQAEGITRTRYEVGQGSQADLLRAQLERARLQQKRWSLQAGEASALAALNRLRGQKPQAEIATRGSLEALPLEVESVSALMERAERESPELQASRSGAQQAEKGLELARLERRPDFGVSAGVMPRGSMPPMWLVGVSISLPVWGRQKSVVAEQEWRLQASHRDEESVRALLLQRIQERASQLKASLGIARLYREGLLVQSEASYRASLAQYEAGRSSFLAVLEALGGWVADRSGYLQALAQVQAQRIAQQELSLAPTASLGTAVLGSPSLAMGAGVSSAGGAAPSRPSGGQTPSSPTTSGSSAMSAM